MSARFAVFLSASIPERPPFEDDVEKYNIREAVIALVGVCHELDLDLVFGGHPAITPLVHHAARSLDFDAQASRSEDARWKVTIYQSEYFEKLFPPEVREFQKRNERLFCSVPAAKLPEQQEELTDFQEKRLRQLSIRAMREEMIGHYRLPYLAGVFIGGMEGIIDEFFRFGQTWRKSPRFPISSTGGATRMGWPVAADPEFLEVSPEDHPQPPQPPLLQQIESDATLSGTQRELLGRDRSAPGFITYRTLFRRLLERDA